MVKDFDWGYFIKYLKVKHYIGYRTEMAYGLGGRELRSVVQYEIEELENTDIIDWTGVSDYIAMIDALYAHGYTEAVWLCKDKQHVIDYYCDGDPACPIEKYEITDGIILSDLGEDGQLVAYGVPLEEEPKERILKETTENGWLYKKVIDEEYAGSLEIWVMGEGEYKIENIDVAPSFRRRGIASELIEEVIKDFVSYNELKWGMQTEEGAKLKEALDKKYKIVKESCISKYSWLKEKYS